MRRAHKITVASLILGVLSGILMGLIFGSGFAGILSIPLAWFFWVFIMNLAVFYPVKAFARKPKKG